MGQLPPALPLSCILQRTEDSVTALEVARIEGRGRTYSCPHVEAASRTSDAWARTGDVADDDNNLTRRGDYFTESPS